MLHCSIFDIDCIYVPNFAAFLNTNLGYLSKIKLAVIFYLSQFVANFAHHVQNHHWIM